MGRKKCSVINCNNKSGSKNVHFFTTSSKELEKKWLAANPVGWRDVQTFYVCSDHFLEENVRVGAARTKLVPADAIPCIFSR